MNRRAFMRAAAISATALVASRALPASALAAPARGSVAGTSGVTALGDLPPYVGAGSTAPVRPFPLHLVRLGEGLLKEKQDRMLHYAREYDERRLLVVFNNNAGRPNPPGVSAPGGWESTTGLLRGHYAGHFLTLLAQSHGASGEQVFKDKLDWVVDELGACQDALAVLGSVHGSGPVLGCNNRNGLARCTFYPGYLGAVPEDVVLRLGPPRWAVYGGNQATNTWAPWYVQHKIMRGLLDAYYLTGNERAFDIVVKMAGWAHQALTLGDPQHDGPITRDDLDYMWDLYIAGEYGGANEVFPELYALTGDDQHLETAKFFDNGASLFDACVDDVDILTVTSGTNPGPRRPNRLHANTHVPQFTGYLRIFEHTGEEDYLLAAKNFFGMVVPHRMYAHGGTSGNYPGSNNNIEMFQNRGNVANSIAQGGAETCTTYNLLKLARNLFFHEQDPAYMDYYERGLLNQIAGSRADTWVTGNPQVTYFQPLTPGGQKGGFGNTGTCCGGTGLENHTKYQESIYFHSADDQTLWVNLYAPSTLDWADRGFTITQETDYPREQGTRLTVDGAGPLDLSLRVPAWVEKDFVIRINGEVDPQLVEQAKPGTYVTLRREWSPGDTVEVAMPFTVRVERAIDRPDTQSFFHGPVLMPILGGTGGGYRELTLYQHLKRDRDYGRTAVTPADGDNLAVPDYGWTLQPWYVGTRPNQSPYWRRVEPEIVFGSITTGVPNHKRNDGLPDYDVPVSGITSPSDDGPTFLDVLWDQGPFPTHAAFMDAVTRTCDEFLDLGIITETEADTIQTLADQAENELTP